MSNCLDKHFVIQLFGRFRKEKKKFDGSCRVVRVRRIQNLFFFFFRWVAGMGSIVSLVTWREKEKNIEKEMEWSSALVTEHVKESTFECLR